MKLLALDTSSNACSVALQTGDNIFDEHVVEPKAHTRILIPMLRGILQDASCKLEQLDAVILGNGPGSFIGMRIAASVAQGLCYGSGLPLVPVSSLAAIAQECFADETVRRVLVAQDARMSEVYLGAYRRAASGLPELVGEVVLQPAAGIQCIAEDDDGPWVASGDGWYRYPVLLDSNRHLVGELSDVRLPKARYLLAPGARALENGQCTDPAELIPDYVRQTVAKIPAASDTLAGAD